MFDKRIEELRGHFGITVLADWADILPAWILKQDKCGPVLLDHLRLILAQHGITLKNDQTPEYWKKYAQAGKILTTLADPDDGNDRDIINPFTVYVDSAEQQPFTFQGIKGDAENKNRPLIIPTEWKPLGRHPDSLGDYSLSGGVGRCHIERKSMEDAQSTILGWNGRRERFERELENLSAIECGVVIVECSFTDLISKAPQYGKRTTGQNAKALSRSIVAFMQDYSVPWLFCDGRRVAEIHAFRWLERWWKKQREKEKQEQKALKKQLEFVGDAT